ncbi:MAG: TIGR03435 family protein [Terriglobia bacterium]
MAFKPSFGRKLLLAGVGIAVVAGPVVCGLVNTPQIRAQSAQATAAPLPSFEVASIKKSRSDELPWGPSFQPGRFTGRAQTINLVIALAYNVYPLQIFGAPSWVNSERYDVQAKESDATAEELGKLPPAKAMDRQALLLQSLLADRFGLKVSHQTKELPVYALVVAKGGPKFQEAKTDDKGPDVQLDAGQLTIRAYPMAIVVTVMSNVMHRTVIDQTGLKGNYDFTVQWRKDETMSGMPRGLRGGDPGPDVAPPDSSGPSFFTALQEQVGLKLVSTKGPVEVIVIEHIERPSEN